MATRKAQKVEKPVEDKEQTMAPTEEPKVTMADIANALNMIDLAVERGAFRGKEITTVGATRDNLDRFVTHQAELQRKAEESSGDSTAE